MFRILFLIWFFMHPVHETLTSIEYVQESNELKGFIRINLEDFLTDCNHHGYVVKIEEMLARTQDAKGILENYINDKLVININKTDVRGKLDEMRINGGELDVRFSFNISSKPVTIKIINKIMTELFEDQSNMMIVKVGEFEEGLKFTSFNTEKTFIIN